MIIVTGAAGFISSCLVSELNRCGYKDVAVVDDFSFPEKNENLVGKELVAKVPRKNFFSWANNFKDEIDFIFHLGARTDTTEFDRSIFDELNLGYSKKCGTCVQRIVSHWYMQVQLQHMEWASMVMKIPMR